MIRTFLTLFSAAVFGFGAPNLNSQSSKITIEESKEVTLDEVFNLIKSQTKDYIFIYPEDLFRGYPKVQLVKGTIRMDRLINNSLRDKDLKAVFTNDNVILIRKKSTIVQELIKGQVVDEVGVPLPGVTVLIKGTYKGVATDLDGNYKIAAAPENVLEFSSLGYTTKTVSVGDRTVINVQLQPSLNELEEVVLNAGYYTVEQKIATGSIAKLAAVDIEGQPVSSPLAALQGRLSGVLVTQTTGIAGSAFEVEIRGRNSIEEGRGQPLYIIDGLPINSENENFDVGGVGTELTRNSGLNINALSSINPRDIQNIEVLKDADATAIYGARGANGVVLITTKRGAPGKTRFEVELQTSFSKIVNRLDLLNTQQFIEIKNEALANDRIEPRPFDLGVNGFFDPEDYTDWQDFFIGATAKNTNLQLAASGGNENTQFRLSGSFNEEENVFVGDFVFRRASLQANFNHVSKDKRFRVNYSSSLSQSRNNLPSNDITGFLLLRPNNPDLVNEDGSLYFPPIPSGQNPIAFTRQPFTFDSFFFNNAVNLNYDILPKLSVKVNAGFNLTNSRSNLLDPITLTSNPATNRFGSQSSSNSNRVSSNETFNVEPLLNWRPDVGFGKLDLLFGGTLQLRKSNTFGLKAINFADDNLVGNVNAANFFTGSETELETNYSSAFARINYNVDDKYILNLTGRRDGSSRFGPGRRFGNFGAVGASWVFSKEKFLEDNNVLTFGKIRASYGVTGNDQIADNQFRDNFIPNGFLENRIVIDQIRVLVEDFSWETVRKFELGLDLGFLNDKITLGANFYRNRTSNQLIRNPVSTVTGFTQFTANLLPAVVENRGFEVELRTRNVSKKNWYWSTDFNITIPRNELIRFDDLENNSIWRNRLIIGEPVDVQQVYKYTGVDPERGLYTFQDFNEDGAIDILNDTEIAKTLRPTFFGALNNSIGVGNFSMNFSMQFVKQEGYNILTTGQVGITNLTTDIFDRWQEPGDIASVQRLSSGASINPVFARDHLQASRNYSQSDGVFNDASFIRLKNLNMGYDIPNEALGSFGVRLYIQAQNLFTITNYKGLDPETQSEFRLPPLTTVALGTRISF